jgi:AcrR family transcriptional regulator
MRSPILAAEGGAQMASLERGRRSKRAAGSVTPVQRAVGRSSRAHASEAHRIRILSAMAQVVCEPGTEPATIASIVGLAGVSRRTFYMLFADRADCLHAVLEEAVALATARAGAAYRAQPSWVHGMRAALLELLQLFDEEPQIAQLCVVHAAAAGPVTLTRRGEVLDQLAAVVDEGRRVARKGRTLPSLTAEGVVGGTLGVIHARLIQGQRRGLVELLNPLMAIIVLPYLGVAAARSELSRPVPDSSPAPIKRTAAQDPLAGLNTRLTYRTMTVMGAIAAQPGLSNHDISRRAGISDQGQISKLLARLARLGLLENTGEGQLKGAANAWRLTSRGREIESAFARESAAATLWRTND